MFEGILILLLIISSLDSKIKNKKLKEKMVLFMIVLISIIEGLRVETGTDWIPYEKFFYRDYRYFEIGYSILNKIFRNLIGEYVYFLFLITLFKNFIIYKVLYRITNKLWIVPIFYGMTVAYIGANRQWIAIAFILLVYKELLSQNIWKVFCYFSLAFLFHKSVVLLVPLLALDFATLKKDIKLKKYILLLISILIIVFITKNYAYNIVENIILPIFNDKIIVEKLNFYTARENKTLQEYYIGVFKYMTLFILNAILILVFYRKNLNKKKGIFIINGFFYGVLIYIVFSLKIQTIVSRGSLYTLYIYIPLLFSFTYDVISIKKIKNFIYFFIILYTLFTFYKMLDLNKSLFVPYKSIFYNKSFKRILY